MFCIGGNGNRSTETLGQMGQECVKKQSITLGHYGSIRVETLSQNYLRRVEVENENRDQEWASRSELAVPFPYCQPAVGP
jgi:hypothetical protein